jgi:hypothetical protein
MTITSAWRDGMRRVNSAPAVLLGMLVLTFLVALPLGLTLAAMLREHLGASMAADQAAAGVNSWWWQEFSEQARGVGTTFTPSILGFGAVMDNLSALLDNRGRAAAVAGTATAYVLLWVFLAGGIVDRYARNRKLRASGFFAACGVFFFRFLRLAVIAGVLYYLLFAHLHPLLFSSMYGWITRDFSVERDAFLVALALYALFGAILIVVNLLLDYAKIRAVVEDRRSMIGAFLAGVRFARRHAGAALGLYLLNGALFVLVLVVYAVVAPGAGSAGWSMWLGFLVTQAYLLARLWVKLLFYASQTAFFQGALAHAEYTARPVAVWPESPAAEAIPPSPSGGDPA